MPYDYLRRIILPKNIINPNSETWPSKWITNIQVCIVLKNGNTDVIYTTKECKLFIEKGQHVFSVNLMVVML